MVTVVVVSDKSPVATVVIVVGVPAVVGAEDEMGYSHMNCMSGLVPASALDKPST